MEQENRVAIEFRLNWRSKITTHSDDRIQSAPILTVRGYVNQ